MGKTIKNNQNAPSSPPKQSKNNKKTIKIDPKQSKNNQNPGPGGGSRNGDVTPAGPGPLPDPGF